MGKTGEKQKRRPKFKDKKQSERFKEAARQLGADEKSEQAERILKAMLIPDPPKVPADTHLGEINSGGIAVLADGTPWRIAPLDLPRARQWQKGTPVVLTSNDANMLWRFRLTNSISGEHVNVTPSVRPPK